jgi:lysylphosphatidylglycerol synthetase-like protein (DUF2156 family)
MANALRFIGRYLATIPLSIGLAVLVIITALITGTFFGPASDASADLWSAGVTSTIDMGHWWTIFTALWVPWDPYQLVACVVLSIVLLGVSERLLGRARLIAIFLITGLIGVGLGVLVQWIGSLAGEWWSEGTSFDLTMDPLAPIAGCLLAATAFMGPLWRRRVRLTTFALLIMFALYNGDTSNVYRLIAAAAGLVIGHLLTVGRRRFVWHRSSFAESRVLIATMVAVTAIGPIISLINPNGSGLFALVGVLFGDNVVPTDQVAHDVCSVGASLQCDQDLALASQGGVGPVLLTFVPLALLIVAAYGLRRGRRAALWLGIGVNVALALLSYFNFDVINTFATSGYDFFSLDFGELVVWVGSSVLVPLAIVALLVFNRHRFSIVAPREASIQFGVTIVLTGIILGAVYTLVSSFALNGFVPGATFIDVLIDVPRRFIPVSFFGTTGPVIVPTGGLPLFVFQWIGPVFWAVAIVAMFRLFLATENSVQVGDHQRIRALLRRGGGGSLGWMATWPGNVYWFSADGQSAIAYRVINGVAITMSDPICRREDATQTIIDFASFCDANSWVPVFYSVHEEYLPAFDGLGWQYMSVGEETLMHPVSLDMQGKPWAKVRQALNRGIKDGMTTLWTTYNELPRPMIAQINAISEAWVSEKELPEMGFTLGALEEIKDPDVKIMLALGPDGQHIQAVTSWLPTYRDGVPIGYTLDFMRRADGSMNGTMEFLIASAALHMQKDGIEVLSLSGAPLAQAPVAAGALAPEPTVMTGLLEFLAKTLEPAYGFSSLFRFKAKFNPTYSTIYMAYPDPLGLPAIGAAIGKAYLPTMSAKETVALVRTLVPARH